ncbi:MAG: hypothetical protein PHY56_03455 [Candidatus Omnitrophica bacterium]|nr:hypothetical protein [Candidatus Omnitrophota bacterium]
MLARRLTYFIVFIWLILWLVFIIRENKPGQYSDLRYLYNHRDYSQRVKRVFGNGLYDFLVFCKSVLPEKSTYSFGVSMKLGYDEVKARYFLWPLKMVSSNPDFIIFYQSWPLTLQVSGYSLFQKYKNLGCILAKTNPK